MAIFRHEDPLLVHRTHSQQGIPQSLPANRGPFCPPYASHGAWPLVLDLSFSPSSQGLCHTQGPPTLLYTGEMKERTGNKRKDKGLSCAGGRPEPHLSVSPEKPMCLDGSVPGPRLCPLSPRDAVSVLSYAEIIGSYLLINLPGAKHTRGN